MPAAKKVYICQPTSGGAEFEVEADRVQDDAATGRVRFFLGNDPVGSFVNINYRIKPSA